LGYNCTESSGYGKSIAGITERRDQKARHFRASGVSDTNLSATTISRILKGEVVDVRTVLQISKWLGVSPSYILSAYLPEGDGLNDKVALLIEKEPRLKGLFVDLVEKLQKNEIDIATVNDILSYSSYRLNLKVHHN